MDQYSFQYCQKIVVFSKDRTKVLLCKRKGEADYDGIFSLIGGKMEVTDKDLLAGLQREKNEEVGKNFKIKICPTYSTTYYYYVKKDGSHMVLPYYLAIYDSGQIELNEEYSEFKLVAINELETFKPLVPTTPEGVRRLLKIWPLLTEKDFVLI